VWIGVVVWWWSVETGDVWDATSIAVARSMVRNGNTEIECQSSAGPHIDDRCDITLKLATEDGDLASTYQESGLE